jgi:hypothetical protein
MRIHRLNIPTPSSGNPNAVEDDGHHHLRSWASVAAPIMEARRAVNATIHLGAEGQLEPVDLGEMKITASIHS